MPSQVELLQQRKKLYSIELKAHQFITVIYCMCLNQQFLNNYIEKLLVMEEVQSAAGNFMDYTTMAKKFYEKLTGQQLD
jgi:hypothetical protein